MPAVGAVYEIAALILGYEATILAVRNKGCGVLFIGQELIRASKSNDWLSITGLINLVY